MEESPLWVLFRIFSIILGRGKKSPVLGTWGLSFDLNRKTFASNETWKIRTWVKILNRSLNACKDFLPKSETFWMLFSPRANYGCFQKKYQWMSIQSRIMIIPLLTFNVEWNLLSPLHKAALKYLKQMTGVLETFVPGGGTAIYGLYRSLPLWRVWISRSLL